MSFASSINAILQASPEITAATGGHIYGTHYPDGLPTDQTVIVFTSKRDDAVHTLQKKNTLEEYSLILWILSVDNELNDSIVPLVRDLLDDYEDAEILDLVLTDEDGGVDQEKQRYFKTLTYRATYLN